MAKKLCFHVCNLFTRELDLVIEQESLPNVSTIVYSPICSQPPMKQKIFEEAFVSTDLEEHLILCEKCCACGNSDCFKLTMNGIPSQNGICLHLVANLELLDYYSRDGGFLVIPGWLSQWQNILSSWGFEQVDVQNFFKEKFNRIVLLDTGVDYRSATLLQEFSAHVHLPFESIAVGLDYFHAKTGRVIDQWKSAQNETSLGLALDQSTKKVEGFTLAFDLVARLAQVMNEVELVNELDTILKTLFSPKAVLILSILNGTIDSSYPQNCSQEKIQALYRWVNESNEEFFVKESNNGFYLRITYLSETIGAVEIDEIANPENINDVIKLALSIAPIFGLALSKAWIFQKLEEDEELLSHLASTDPLTCLFNRRYFLEAAGIEYNRVKRYGSELSAIMLDIDHFKQVNDTYGHAVGDQVLVEIALLLRKSLRQTDVIARLGGDEFILLLPETPLVMAEALAGRVCKKISETEIHHEGLTFHVTSSLGVITMDETCNDLDEFMVHGDNALYMAKANGRNQYAVWKKE